MQPRVNAVAFNNVQLHCYPADAITFVSYSRKWPWHEDAFEDLSMMLPSSTCKKLLNSILSRPLILFSKPRALKMTWDVTKPPTRIEAGV